MVDIYHSWNPNGDGDAFCLGCNMFIGWAPRGHFCGDDECKHHNTWYRYETVSKNSLEASFFHQTVCDPKSRCYFYAVPLLLDPESRRPILIKVYTKNENTGWRLVSKFSYKIY